MRGDTSLSIFFWDFVSDSNTSNIPRYGRPSAKKLYEQDDSVSFRPKKHKYPTRWLRGRLNLATPNAMIGRKLGVPKKDGGDFARESLPAWGKGIQM